MMISKRLEELKDEDLERLFSRQVGIQDVLPKVSEIVTEVASDGDKALFKYTEALDKARLPNLKVSEEEIAAAYEAADDDLVASLGEAAENIFNFHDEQRERDFWLTEVSPGVFVGQKTVP